MADVGQDQAKGIMEKTKQTMDQAKEKIENNVREYQRKKGVAKAEEQAEQEQKDLEKAKQDEIKLNKQDDTMDEETSGDDEKTKRDKTKKGGAGAKAIGLAVSGFKKLAGVKEDSPPKSEEKSDEPSEPKRPGYSEIKQQKMASRPRQPGSLDESVSEVIDRDLVIGLKNDLGIETMRELLRETLNQSEELLLDIRHEIDDQHIARLRAKAHSLKGMSANFGLVKMAAVASEIEEAGKHEDIGAASEYHAQALRVYDKTEDALESILLKK